jgi:hypothetical protein
MGEPGTPSLNGRPPTDPVAKDPVPNGRPPTDPVAKDPVPNGRPPKDPVAKDPVPNGWPPKDPVAKDPVPNGRPPKDPVAKDPVVDDSLHGPASTEEGELPASLEEALLLEADELPALTVQRVGARHEFRVGSRIVATLDGPVAEFRLDPAVATAALRTPGTRLSASAPDRIAFQPVELDLYALDRAVAWLRSAVRLATR